jgi:MoaA/NifB/PqqE/SkfB family radical SAM enzyme
MNKYNQKEVIDFIHFSKKLNVPLSLLDLTPTIKDYEEGLIIPDNIQNREFFGEMKTYAKNLNVEIGLFNFDNRKTTNTKLDEKKLSEVVKRCKWIEDYSFIATNGDVGICCWSDYKTGNIFNNSFLDIWFGERYNNIRKCIAKGDTTYCKNCRREG